MNLTSVHVARKTFTSLKAKSRKRNADVVGISRFSHDVAEIVEVSLKTNCEASAHA